MLFVWLTVVVFGLVLMGVLYGVMFVLRIKSYGFFKVVSFESGFKGIGKTQSSFRVHFFLMMLMFVVFDLEVILLMGLVVTGGAVVEVYFVLFFFVVGGFFME